MIASLANEPSFFTISIYSGQMLITGRVAPSAYWYGQTQTRLEANIHDSIQSARAKHRQPLIDEANIQIKAIVDELGRICQNDVTGDEVTLFDVTVVPAFGTDGTQPGGLRLPVARVPFASVDMWWIADGSSFAGRGASQVGVGIGVGFVF
jgi:hypothetical protein